MKWVILGKKNQDLLCNLYLLLISLASVWLQRRRRSSEPPWLAALPFSWRRCLCVYRFSCTFVCRSVVFFYLYLIKVQYRSPSAAFCLQSTTVREADEPERSSPGLETLLKHLLLIMFTVLHEKERRDGGGVKKKKEPNTDDTAAALWKGEQEGYCGCPHVIGKEPQYLPSLSIIKAATAVEPPALKRDWRSFDEADGQLQGSRLLGRHWPARERERARWGRGGELWEGQAGDASELLRISGGWWAAASRRL